MSPLHLLSIAAILALGAATGAAAAEGDAVKDAARKAEQGFGSVLKGIGQAAKKAGEAVSSSVKKKDDQPAKPQPAEQDSRK